MLSELETVSAKGLTDTMLKNWFAALLGGLMTVLGGANALAQQSSVRVLAVVNDDIITDASASGDRGRTRRSRSQAYVFVVTHV